MYRKVLFGLALVPIGLSGVYAAGYIYQTVQNTLKAVSELKAQAEISEIYYNAFMEAASPEVRDQIINDLQFGLLVLREEQE